MGIINWMQSRFHGKTENRIFDGATATSSYRGAGAQERQQTIIQESEKRLDAEPWPQAGLLSIGTLGNEEPPLAAAQEQEQDLPEFTVEEVKKLQDALAMLLRRAKSKSSSRGSGAGAGEDRPPLDRFLNCPSCLEVDRRVQTTTKHGECDGHEGEGDLSPDTKIILTRARDLLDSGSGGGSIKQRSFKFLLKKVFACNGGFSTAPPRGLKDPVESRMEKFFRTVIGKKMNARSGNGSATSRKYFLEDGTKGKRRGGRRRGCREDEEEEEEREESCRWDRTDSEFIVLEI
ncbi:protein NEGATIVE GRAVITROPIC RESPONSE OF ROOTS-like [Miscanthus floridulus]|uniref:protein NEGATIVE GRAVITROPIC RESPONSE OF ROOTS-like n=1 Tax=Miscanthus floridulus TaxID=154761 RepID=UPI0034588D7E